MCFTIYVVSPSIVTKTHFYPSISFCCPLPDLSFTSVIVVIFVEKKYKRLLKIYHERISLLLIKFLVRFNEFKSSWRSIHPSVINSWRLKSCSYKKTIFAKILIRDDLRKLKVRKWYGSI